MIKEKVIIDCDPGIDDTLALIYALKNPKLEVKAITIVAGNAPVDFCAKNAAIVLKKLNLNIPIYVGEKQPLEQKFISAQDTHGYDGLGETFFEKETVFTFMKQNASTFLANYFSKNSDTSIIALGPLTNIAKALDMNPNLGINCKRFVSMGGTYKSHGNCSPVAEFNYWCDPDAAKKVYKYLSTKIEMIGLDITRKIVLTPNIMHFIKLMDNEISTFIQNMIAFYWDFHWEHEKIIGCVINDPLAVSHFINSNICHGFDSYVDIETSGIAKGQSIVDSYNFYNLPANATIYTQVDKLEFFTDFISILCNCDKEYIKKNLLNLGEFCE